MQAGGAALVFVHARLTGLHITIRLDRHPNDRCRVDHLRTEEIELSGISGLHFVLVLAGVRFRIRRHTNQ